MIKTGKVSYIVNVDAYFEEKAEQIKLYLVDALNTLCEGEPGIPVKVWVEETPNLQSNSVIMSMWVNLWTP